LLEVIFSLTGAQSATEMPRTARIYLNISGINFGVSFWPIVTVLVIYIYIQYYIYNIVFDNDISDSDYINLKTPQRRTLCLSCAFCIVSTRRECFRSARPATRCNTMQHAATRCNTLQHTLDNVFLVRSSSFSLFGEGVRICTHCNTLNTLQHTATRRNTLQHPATPCNTLQHPATPCNTLQHTATHAQHSLARELYMWSSLIGEGVHSERHSTHEQDLPPRVK